MNASDYQSLDQLADRQKEIEIERIPDGQSEFVYNGEFAKRFHLDPSRAVDLSEGVMAMEIVAIKVAHSEAYKSQQVNVNKMLNSHSLSTMKNYRRIYNSAKPILREVYNYKQPLKKAEYQFIINLYLSDNLEIKYPYRSAIIENNLSDHVIPIINCPIEIDHRAGKSIDKMMTMNKNMRALPYSGMSAFPDDNSFENKAYVGNPNNLGATSRIDRFERKLDYRRYKRNIVDGINYVSFGPAHSFTMEYMKADPYISLRKRSAKDEKDPDPLCGDCEHLMTPESFYTFKIPRASLKRILSLLATNHIFY